MEKIGWNLRMNIQRWQILALSDELSGRWRNSSQTCLSIENVRPRVRHIHQSPIIQAIPSFRSMTLATVKLQRRNRDSSNLTTLS